MGLNTTKMLLSINRGYKGDIMSSEQIISRLERELGANWWDSTDQYERA